MSNKLKNESSPYLLQHAENPVNWYPWGDEAFEKAKNEDKPIFLSIGYSTCHWCHVMAHENFEDEEVAKILNKYFISIKVDREERPDIDSVYMSVCQAFIGSGGWPMSIFMTWDKKPFFAGTYFPPHPKYGMVSFSELLEIVVDKWNTDREGLLQSAKEITEQMKKQQTDTRKGNDGDLIQKSIYLFSKSFDKDNGGFGAAPKFPTPHNLLFLMLYSKINRNTDVMYMAEKTLLQMRWGGIFDHIGGGFSRYSTDKYFLVPHFEKMLYDNALLTVAYSTAYSCTKNKLYLDTAQKTAEYILREMTSDEGGFYSAQDADSDGVEGKYYTFSKSEIIEVLGKENDFANAFDITEKGNFEGTNIPNLLKNGETNEKFDKEINKLYDYRKKRTKLHLDDKILLSWNCMMISSLSMLYRASQNEKYLSAAKKACEFVENNLKYDMQLYTSFRDGKHSEQSFLDDYAFYITALVEMYNSTLKKDYLDKAELFCEETVKRFADNKNGGFYMCKTDSTELFVNPKETYDGAIPSGNSVMTYNFVRLYQLTEKEEYKELAENQIKYMEESYPTGNSMFLLSKLLYENPPKHITVVLKDKDSITNLPFIANVIVAQESKEYPLLNGKTTYYVCENNNCLPPSNEI